MNSGFKSNIVALFISEIDRVRSELNESIRESRLTAREAPSAMESHSDTTRNQAQVFLGSLTELLKRTDDAIKEFQGYASGNDAISTVGAGSLVLTENDERERALYFLTLSAAGYKVSSGGESIFSISTESPLGSALSGTKIGDLTTMPNSRKSVRIIEVQ